MNHIRYHIWTFDQCFNDAKKYKTRLDWQKNSRAYKAAAKRRWLDKCCTHMQIVGNLFNRMIYAFEFSDKSIYIGLTHNIESRKSSHLINTNRKKSPVYLYSLKTKLTPQLIKLTKYLPNEIAIQKEIYFINKYRKMGWNILNNKVGGGLGGNSIKWTKEKCIEDARKYQTHSAWIGNSTSYNSAQKHGWLNECTKHMMLLRHPSNHWTKENCVKDAKKFKFRSDWWRKSKCAYNTAIRHKWIEICCTHMKPKPRKQMIFVNSGL